MKGLGLVPMDAMPPVEVIGVEVRDPLGPYGAKGVGEVGLVPTAAAVAGAFCVFDAWLEWLYQWKRRKSAIEPG